MPHLHKNAPGYFALNAQTPYGLNTNGKHPRRHAASDTLHWRYNEHDAVSNHQRLNCLLNRLFRCGSKKTSELRVTGLCKGNSPVIGHFPHKRLVARNMFPFDDVIMSFMTHKFLSLDLLSEYRIQHGAIGPLYVTSSYSTWVFGRGVSGFATECPCDVWCRGLTTCLLHVGPPSGNRFLNTSWAVGLIYWIVYLHFFCILTYAIIYVLIHHIIFWLYLYFLNILFLSTPEPTSSIDVVFVLSIKYWNYKTIPWEWIEGCGDNGRRKI